MLKLALQSLWARRLTAGLTLLAVAISVTLLLRVERVRSQARDSFANTVSGTDLIVGARSGQVNLLLYSVFCIGNPSPRCWWGCRCETPNRAAGSPGRSGRRR